MTEVYLEVKQNAPGLSFPANLVGGMATPNFDVSGIARDLGPVGGDLNDLLAGKFDPSKYFNMLSGDAGKLLGAISVADIIALIDPNDAASNAQAPQISDKIIYPDDDDTKPPTALDVKIDWTPTVTGDKPGFFQPGSNAALTIQAEIYTPVADPSQTTYSIHGDLTDFGLLLFGNDSPFILVSFNSFTFDSKTGAKTSIQPDIDSVTFKGPSHLHPGLRRTPELTRRAFDLGDRWRDQPRLFPGFARHRARCLLLAEPGSFRRGHHSLRRDAGRESASACPQETTRSS